MKGNELRKNNKDNLYIVHIINKKDKILYGDNDGDALEYLFELSKKLDAELIIRRSSNTIKQIISLAKELNATDMILGKSNNEKENSFHKKISKNLKKINIEIEWDDYKCT